MSQSRAEPRGLCWEQKVLVGAGQSSLGQGAQATMQRLQSDVCDGGRGLGRFFPLGWGSGASSQLIEQPVPTCVSLGKGSVVYDSSFDLFKEIGHLCRLCKAIAGNSELVKPGGAQCLPSGVWESHLPEGGHTREAVLPLPG